MFIHIYSYFLVSVVLIVTPGPDTALTIRNSLVGGARGGIATAAGVCLGQLVWGLASALGVAALLAASHPAFVTVRVCGAAYLIYLGLLALRSALRGTADARDDSSADSPIAFSERRKEPRRRALRQGLLSNLGNPKMAIFFISLLPQFTSSHKPALIPLLLLGIIFSTMTFTWLCAYAAVIDRIGDVVRRPRVRQRLEALTGVALIGLGARITAEIAR